MRASLLDEELTGTIIACAIEVHRELGPGLREDIYEKALGWELGAHGLKVEHQVPVNVTYKGMDLNDGGHPKQLDILVEKRIVVEVKAVSRNEDVFQAQCLTYLKMMHLKTGLVLNFGMVTLKAGLRRVANEGRTEYRRRIGRENPQQLRAILREEENLDGSALDNAFASYMKDP